MIIKQRLIDVEMNIILLTNLEHYALMHLCPVVCILATRGIFVCVKCLLFYVTVKLLEYPESHENDHMSLLTFR